MDSFISKESSLTSEKFPVAYINIIIPHIVESYLPYLNTKNYMFYIIRMYTHACTSLSISVHKLVKRK